MNMIFMRSFIQSAGEGLEIPHKLTLDQVMTAYRKSEAELQQKAPELLNVVDMYTQHMTALGQELANRGLINADDLKATGN